MLRDLLLQGIVFFDYTILLYFFLLNTIYLLFTAAAFVELRRHQRRWTARDLDAVMRSPDTPGISLVVPTFNEGEMLVESVQSLLMLNYPQHEVIVVNDGSSDRTLEITIEAFDLVRTEMSTAAAIPTKEVRGVYRSLAYPNLTLVDKANGGKADAMNAGANVARQPLVCVIDADSLLDPDALTRAVLPFLEDPTTLVTGGIVRIVNDCHVENGRVVRVMLPRGALARFQVTEYLRAFLAGRVAQSMFNSLLIISGAFGVFRREALLGIGGFDTTTVGEDMEIVVRLHRWCRENKRPYRIVFRADAVCWTEAPESLTVLQRQRNRWQRGTCQVLSRHRRMIFNPRYGVVGMLAMPFYLAFEALGPLIEVAGYIVTIFAVAIGVLDWRFAELLFLVAVCYGALISLAAIILEEMSMRRYPRVVDLLILAAFGVIENFGYRQLTTWWRLRGFVDFLRGKGTWGVMPRRGFQRPASGGANS